MRTATLLVRLGACALIALAPAPRPVLASAPSAASLARLAAAQPVSFIVEFSAADTDAAASAERVRRHLRFDDTAILSLRAQGYSAAKSAVESAVAGSDAGRARDYPHLPLAVWRLSSRQALARLRAHPSVRGVYEDKPLHVNSVSDLSFIGEPQASAEGANGAGTTIAVIDGGLGNNYLTGAGDPDYSDFGTCTGVASPAGSCRVIYNQDFYVAPNASAETAHGTSVSAIALGVAPAANLAMFDVFKGTSAAESDVLSAMDTILSYAAAKAIGPIAVNIVALNLSLGDGASNPSQCGSGANASPFTAAIGNLANAGVTTVAAAGNSGSKSGLADPACVPGVVSVGAVYSAASGTWGWVATADSGGECIDTSAPDLVTCFSQSAAYLTMLAPGAFVIAPNDTANTITQSGTSQATPHVTGAIAVLRARYPAEPLSETVQRLTDSGPLDTDPANGRALPRLDLLAAVNEGSAVYLTGGGPSTAVAGGTGTYSLTVTNSGPLLATDVAVADTLPAGAIFSSASSGCSYAAGVVTCSASSLPVGSALNYSINVLWQTSGPVADTARLTLDQSDTASTGELAVFGATATDPGSAGDGPMPPWGDALLAAMLMLLGGRYAGMGGSARPRRRQMLRLEPR